MRFGENSRKGASSLIVVMLVAVIALAGTAVYVALDRTVLTTYGYALPGSTLTYSSVEDGTDITYTIYGYDNGDYVWKYANGLTTESIPEEYFVGTEQVDVPGIGKTEARVYAQDEGSTSMTMRTVFHGLPFDATMNVNGVEVPFMKMISADIELGSYDSVQKSTKNFTSSSGSAEINRVSKSIDGDFLYKVTFSNVSSIGYYVGDDNGVPVDATNNRFIIEGSSSLSLDITLNISGSSISSIVIGSVTYTAST